MAITKFKNNEGQVRWRVNLQPGGRTGKQVKRVFETQGEAKHFEIWVKSQHQADAEWAPSKKDQRRLSELIELWHAAHGRELAAGADTKARLLAMCDKMQNPTPNLVRSRFNEYRQARIDEGLSLQTVNREDAYLRAVFNELKRLGQWTAENPVSSIRQFKTKERELSYLVQEQIDVLLKELDSSSNPHAKLITKIALSTGGRWSECEKLKLQQTRAGRIQFAHTKSGKTRAIPISSELTAEIEAHARMHPTGTDALFASSYGAFLSALERTQISLPDGQASHVLRHTFASHFMINGGNILTLQRALGHASLAMTMRYAHLAPDHMKEVLALNPLAAVGTSEDGRNKDD